MWHTNVILWFGTVLLTAYQLWAQEVRTYGKACLTDHECMDHRMSCLYNGTDRNKTFCLCNRFFTWNEEVQQCTQVANMSEELMSLREHQDHHALNSISEHETFIKLGVVGLCSVISICTFILCCIAYGCCSCTRLDESTSKEALCPANCPIHNAATSDSEKGQDKWKDLPTSMPTDFDDIDI
ncbi:hypothetical protein C0J52_21592 [Blattella germanica]|nr:hypothetical protein C0J52_21592 [Blattella germanica]